MLKRSLKLPFRAIQKAAEALKSGGRDQPAPTRYRHGEFEQNKPAEGEKREGDSSK